MVVTQPSNCNTFHLCRDSIWKEDQPHGPRIACRYQPSRNCSRQRLVNSQVFYNTVLLPSVGAVYHKLCAVCYKGGEKSDDKRLKEREERVNWRRERVGGYEQRSLSQYGG